MSSKKCEASRWVTNAREIIRSYKREVVRWHIKGSVRERASFERYSIGGPTLKCAKSNQTPSRFSSHLNNVPDSCSRTRVTVRVRCCNTGKIKMGCQNGNCIRGEGNAARDPIVIVRRSVRHNELVRKGSGNDMSSAVGGNMALSRRGGRRHGRRRAAG